MSKQTVGNSMNQQQFQVRTVGDLWKALHEGKRFANLLNSDVSVIALLSVRGGASEETMRKLIARVALAKGVDRREIVNMPLARFVEALCELD